jgi:predicted PurR-regulated permease PerM
MTDLIVVILVWAAVLALAFYPIMRLIDYLSRPRRKWPPERDEE